MRRVPSGRWTLRLVLRWPWWRGLWQLAAHFLRMLNLQGLARMLVPGQLTEYFLRWRALFCRRVVSAALQAAIWGKALRVVLALR